MNHKNQKHPLSESTNMMDKVEKKDPEEKTSPRENGCSKWFLRVTGLVTTDMTEPNWKYIRIMFAALFSSSFSIVFILPFLPEMVLSLGYKEEEKGYYCGLVISSVFAGRACGSYFWGWLSDKKGRRPILLATISLNGLFSFLFGFSTSIPVAMVLRFLSGLANGTVGTAKTVLYEISDDTNQALGMSTISFAWGLGLILGPTIGGFLASPVERFPHVFKENGFFSDYAFLLSSTMAGLVCLSSFTYVFFTFEETLKKKNTERDFEVAVEKLGDKCSLSASPAPSNIRRRFSNVSAALNFSIENFNTPSQLYFASIEKYLPYADEDDVGSYNYHEATSSSEKCLPDNGCDVVANSCSKSGENIDLSVQKGLEKADEENALSTSPYVEIIDENNHLNNDKDNKQRDRHKANSENPPIAFEIIKAGAFPLEENKTENNANCEINKNGSVVLKDSATTSQQSDAKGNKSSWIYVIRHSKLVTLLSESDVRACVMMYALFSFGVVAFDDIFIVLLSTEPRLDGIGFSSGQIGTSLGAVAGPLMFFQIFCYPAIAKKLGLRWTYILAALLILIPVQLIPMLHLIYDKKVMLWTFLMLLLIPERAASNFCFASISLMINNSVNPENAGSVNGIAMTLTALLRTLGPSIAGSLFSWSVTHGVHLGIPFDINFCFVLIGIVFLLCIIQGVFLPKHLDKQKK